MRLYTIDLIGCGERLADIQRYLVKTNGEMASILDISPDYYRSVKRGDSLLTIERAAVLYDKYNIDLNYLYFGILVNGSFIINRRNDRTFESFIEEGMIAIEAEENKNNLKRIISYLLRVTERLINKM